MSFDTWQKLKLSDFLEINPKRLVSKDSLISFIDMAALPINGRDILKCNIAEKKFNGGGAKFRNGDTLLARITPCLENGKTAFVNCLSNDDVAFGSTEFIVLAPKNKSDSLFVYYLVRSDNFRSYIIPRMEGTSGRQRVPNNAVGEYECFFPPLNELVEIASILSSLDNRISLLRETNTTLEAIAQTLFKSWFVDFDPVKAKAEGRLPEGMDEATAALFPSEFEESALGLIPKGWSNVSLKEVVSIFDSQRVPLSGGDRAKRKGNYPYYGAASLMDYVDGYIFDGVYCLMGEDGSVAHESGYPIMQYVWGKIWVNNHAHVLQGKNGISTEHVMLSLQRTNIQPLITGAVQAKLSQGNMWRIVFLMPSRSIAEVFGEMIAPLFTRIRHNFEKIQTLTTLRDTLLPRLISGQLRLNQAQDFVYDVEA